MTTNTSDNTNIGLGYSPDALAERKAELLNLLGQVAPELLSDNQLNIDKLKDLLAGDITDLQEHYELNWAGKAAARREVQKTTSSTLLPDPNNPAQAQHMLIEGENLEVLRVLQKSYYGKVKMIYIDPPYNTGNDSFVYPDDYSETLDEYLKRTGEKNEDGYLNKQSLWKKNSKESGQYHSAWLSMMYPRLYLARNLLRDDGVIFISIDDNEQANLKLLCDEVFGEESFIAKLPVVMNLKGNQDSFGFADTHEYCYVYAKNIDHCEIGFFDIEDEELEREWSEDDWGLYKRADTLRRTGQDASRASRPKGWFPVFINKNQEVYVTEDDEPLNKEDYVLWPINDENEELSWSWGKKKITEEPHNLIVIEGRNGKNIYKKQRPLLGDLPTSKAKTIWYKSDYSTSTATTQLRKLLGKKVFEGTKPVPFIKDILIVGSSKNSVILDFFAGSGTTAHAVMELNAEDGGNRQSISVQLPELLDEKSEAYKAGYRTIADITRARIEKVIAKLKAEKPDQNQDLACAHFKLAPSNFKVWRSDLADVDAVRSQLEIFQQAEKSVTPNVHKDDSDQQAMLTELLLKNGLGALGVHAISKPKLLANGMTIHRVLMNDDRLLWLCFDAYQQGFKDEVITANPAQVIMLNSCFNTVGEKADEYISNLQLELQHYGIGLLII
ncbi:TPA: site-specific DNA-methyltransferase [Proteus mirabilis]